jgi:hypothetical protein
VEYRRRGVGRIDAAAMLHVTTWLVGFEIQHVADVAKLAAGCSAEAEAAPSHSVHGGHGSPRSCAGVLKASDTG